jgi:hypothetical protein
MTMEDAFIGIVQSGRNGSKNGGSNDAATGTSNDATAGTSNDTPNGKDEPGAAPHHASPTEARP